MFILTHPLNGTFFFVQSFITIINCKIKMSCLLTPKVVVNSLYVMLCKPSAAVVLVDGWVWHDWFAFGAAPVLLTLDIKVSNSDTLRLRA